MSSRKKIYIGYTVSHNCSVAALDEDGQVLVALSEERFTREKLQTGYPTQAMKHVLDHYAGDRDVVICFARLDTLRRAGRTVHYYTRSLLNGHPAAPVGAIFGKLLFQLTREQSTKSAAVTLERPRIDHYVDHHVCHAASAYYHSGFEQCYVMTLDGVGNYLSCTFSVGRESQIDRYQAYYQNEVTVGEDYEVITGMLGFDPLRHPGKITGLAAYGSHNDACIRDLGAFLEGNWNKKEKSYYLQFFEGAGPEKKKQGLDELRALRSVRFKAYSSEDLAFALQYITEEKVKTLIRKHIPEQKGKCIALAGGVFANVKVNQRIQEMGFENVFIQPAMDDSGLALGAAFSVLSRDKKIRPYPVSSMYLGTSYSDDAVVKALDAAGLKYEKYEHVEKKIAELIHDKKVVARFNGAMEFGPRALGNRSILYEATNPEVNHWLNQRLGRTEFMPFAPVTLAEEAERCYRNLEGIRHPLKFMTITVDCTDWAIQHIPAVVHVDRTARPQLITEEDNPSYYRILNEYYRLSGIPVLVNTSFNMHEEPIVATPEDAVRAFVRGNLDCLAIHDYVVLKDGDEAGR